MTVNVSLVRSSCSTNSLPVDWFPTMVNRNCSLFLNTYLWPLIVTWSPALASPKNVVPLTI